MNGDIFFGVDDTKTTTTEILKEMNTPGREGSIYYLTFAEVQLYSLVPIASDRSTNYILPGTLNEYALSGSGKNLIADTPNYDSKLERKVFLVFLKNKKNIVNPIAEMIKSPEVQDGLKNLGYKQL